MTLLAWIFCIVIFGIGVACIAAPSRIVDVMVRHSARMLYLAAGFRILLGTVLMLAAPASRAPDFLYILGIVIIVAGVALLFVGQKGFGGMIKWLVARGPGFVRVWGVVGLLLALALGYALTPWPAT